MVKKKTMMMVSIGMVLLLGPVVASSQSDVIKGGLIPQYGADQEVLWVWGPVISVDSQKNEIKIKYFDYENDQEKEMTVATDEKTGFENIKSLDEIKVNDALSIDYVISPDGKNTARNISVEKPEEPILPTQETIEPEPAKDKKN